MSTNKLPEFFINAFYESKFRDNVFIIKASGAVIEDETARNSLMSNIYDLTMQGIKIILVYGHGALVDKEVEARGIGTKRVNGRRVTDAATLGVIKHIAGGDLSLSVFQSMFKNKLDGLSFNAIPADWLSVSKRPPTKDDQCNTIEWGFVGDIEETFPRPIRRLLKTSNFIAVPCIAIIEKSGDLCNINADTIATDIAKALKADKLIFMSNVDGVKIKDETAFMLTSDDIPKLIKDGVVTDGMKVKMENCLRALDSGVKRIHLINGLRENALFTEIFESVGPGTMLLREEERANYMNEVEVQKLISRKK